MLHSGCLSNQFKFNNLLYLTWFPPVRTSKTRFYEPARLSTPPKPLFSLKPLDATIWLRSLLSEVFLSSSRAKLWNALPHEIRSISNINTFKRHLKTHLFSNALLNVYLLSFLIMYYIFYFILHIINLIF